MNVIALIISALALLFAGLSWWISKQTRNHQLISELRKDYLSPQMHYAVKTLWEFRDKCQKEEKDFVEEYKNRFNEDKERISMLNESKRLEAEHSTLHYQRRVVSHFYQYVANLYKKRLLPKDIVFEIWAEKDLRIIPNVIIPIEMKLHEIIERQPLQPTDEHCLPDDLSTLHRLYIDSKDYKFQKTTETPKPASNSVKES